MRVGLIFMLLIVLPMAAASAERADQTVSRGIDLIHQGKHDEALALFDGLIKLDPGDPRGYFFKAEVYFWMYLMDDFQDETGDTFSNFLEG